MRNDVKKTIDLFKDQLNENFGSRLIDIIIYGSVIRGGFNEDSSDIDFIVLIQDELFTNDIKFIETLHKKYRKSNTLSRLLEGRYVGLRNDKFVNGYYVGTNQKGWKPISEIGFDGIESAMILDAYESIFHKHNIINLLHVSWDQIVNEIRNQIDEFISNDLIGRNEAYTRYALVTASRSLYTYIEVGFISKNEVIEWMRENYFEINFNNPKLFLSKIKAIITPVNYVKDEDYIVNLFKFIGNILDFQIKNKDYTSERHKELIDQFYKNPEFITYMTDNDRIVAALTMKHSNENEITLKLMAVDPAYRGLGYGRTLINHAETKALQYNYNLISLGARLSSIHFYEKMGYKPLILIQNLSEFELAQVIEINRSNNNFFEVNRFQIGEHFSIFFNPIVVDETFIEPFKVLEGVDIMYMFTKNLK
jgi:GNAT superfamily N-acetyltransferase/predicted nucleotidyltransferase